MSTTDPAEYRIRVNFEGDTCRRGRQNTMLHVRITHLDGSPFLTFAFAQNDLRNDLVTAIKVACRTILGCVDLPYECTVSYRELVHMELEISKLVSALSTLGFRLLSAAEPERKEIACNFIEELGDLCEGGYGREEARSLP